MRVESAGIEASGFNGGDATQECAKWGPLPKARVLWILEGEVDVMLDQELDNSECEAGRSKAL